MNNYNMLKNKCEKCEVLENDKINEFNNIINDHLYTINKLKDENKTQ